MDKSQTIFSVDGLRINDSWYCFDNEKYHMYFLQYPLDGNPEGLWSEQSVGHAVSHDLIHWVYQGVVLEPDAHGWNNKGIATGSNVFYNDLWYMLYTGNAFNSHGGFGLAVSSDLHAWKRIEDGPAIIRGIPYKAKYQGMTYTCDLSADPYIYPHKIDGWFYVYINATVREREINQKGCQLIMKSKNLMDWEIHKIAMICDDFDTTENRHSLLRPFLNIFRGHFCQTDAQYLSCPTKELSILQR